MESNWKDYFTFTKKERTGIVTLLVLIGVITAIPYCFSPAAAPDKAMIAAFNAQKQLLQQINSDTAAAERNDYYKPYPKRNFEAGSRAIAAAFPFDPNTLPAAGWERLGLNQRTIHTIQNYIAKGGRFRHASDLQKIYGLPPRDCERLMRYVQIADTASHALFKHTWPPREKYIKPPPAIVDINQADTNALIALPGIGSRLANRIVNFRERLGGFCSVQQLAEVYGLPDSTFQLIKPQLQCAATMVRKININTADAAALKQHPYIKWNIANAIVQYRQQHGAYHSPQDLQQIAIITPELLQKITAYITVE
jgi:DNA uptake protein ComE-like DNA-binding protein